MCRGQCLRLQMRCCLQRRAPHRGSLSQRRRSENRGHPCASPGGCSRACQAIARPSVLQLRCRTPGSTPTRDRACPFQSTAKATLDRLCVTGSTSFCSAGSNSGLSTSTAFRPPPLRLSFTNPSTRARPRTSLRPSVTVLMARPVARATSASPPRPIASASAPAHRRLIRSCIAPLRRENLRWTVSSRVTRTVDCIRPSLSIPSDRFISTRALSELTETPTPRGGPLCRSAQPCCVNGDTRV